MVYYASLMSQGRAGVQVGMQSQLGRPGWDLTVGGKPRRGR